MLIIFACGAGFVSAQDSATPTVPAISSTETGAAAPAKPVAVEGFRSAHFGMDEAAVRQAIIADFGVTDDAIGVAENTAERTKILTIAVPNVLQDGGKSQVSYVLGYSSKQLDQVSVLWSSETDAAIDGQKLVANANVLQAYFLGNGFDTAASVVNVPVPEGVVMFRGVDADNHMALLLLRGTTQTPAPAADGQAVQTVFTPSSLLLAYLAKPNAPDVFAVPAGQF